MYLHVIYVKLVVFIYFVGINITTVLFYGKVVMVMHIPVTW